MAFINGKKVLNVGVSGTVSVVGAETVEGGEIFNDYENNIAGGRGFAILAKTAKTLTLSSVENLAIGDVFSLKIDNNYDEYGTITKISTATNTITVSVDLPKEDLIENSRLWIPAKPLAGDTLLDGYQHAEGYNTVAIMGAAHAEGCGTTAAGRWSHAEGKDTRAAYAAHAEGNGSVALGQGSHAEGNNTQATSLGAHSEGEQTVASGAASHAEGNKTQAAKIGAHAEGGGSKATGAFAHAEGDSTTASGTGAHSEGGWNTAAGDNSHSEGFATHAGGKYAHAEGNSTVANGNASHAGGKGTKATAEAQTSIGTYNKTNENALLIVGIGADKNNPNNGFEVLKDGSLALNCGGENLLNVFPSYEFDGVTDNGDGTYTVNGTVGDNLTSAFGAFRTDKTLPAGAYTLRLEVSDKSAVGINFHIELTDGTTFKEVTAGETFVLTSNFTVNNGGVYMTDGATFENVTVKPLLFANNTTKVFTPAMLNKLYDLLKD